MPTDPIVGDVLLAEAIILAGGAIGAEIGDGMAGSQSSPVWPDNPKRNHGCSHRF